MATTNDTVYVEIIAKTNQAVQGMANFAKQIAATYLSWKAFQTLIVGSFKEFMKAEDAQTRLGAAIRITGQQSTASVRVLSAYAKELQNLTNYEEEATMSAMGLLMQLGGLTQEGVKKTIPLLQDFASTFGMDLTQAAELFGKTIGSSTNALSRYGIVLKEGLSPQEKMASILEQLQQKMGGFAKEMANTTSGKLTALKIQIDEVKEAFGGLLATIGQSDVFQQLLGRIKKDTEMLSWGIGGWKIKLADVTKYTKQQLVDYNIELNKARKQFEDSIANSRTPANIRRQNEKEIAAIEARMAEVNRMLQRGQYAATPGGGPSPGALTTVGEESPVVKELTDEQKAAQAMRDEWVELRKQAILYQKEVQNNRDVSSETYEHLNGQLNAYTEIIDSLGYVGGQVEAVSKETKEAAETVAVDWVGAFETIGNLTVDIAKTMGAAFASGDILGGLNQVAQKLLSMMSMMALEAAFGAARDGMWPLALLFLGIAGITAFTGGALSVGGGGANSGVEVPRMAAGGVVTRPTLAVIGEAGPEAVVPLSRGGAGGVTINVQGSIWQTEDLARAVAGAMGRW